MFERALWALAFLWLATAGVTMGQAAAGRFITILQDGHQAAVDSSNNLHVADAPQPGKTWPVTVKSGNVISRNCNGTACANFYDVASDNAAMTGLALGLSVGAAYNGSSYDRFHSDPNSLGAGILRVSTGGTATATIAPAAGSTTIVSTTARRVWSFLATSYGNAQLICYDNAAAASGTIVLETPSKAIAGTEYGPINGGRPLRNGLTCDSEAGAPAGTFSLN